METVSARNRPSLTALGAGLACVLTASLAFVVPANSAPSTSAAASPSPRTLQDAASPAQKRSDARRPSQTSDGVPGIRVGQRVSGRRTATIANEQHYQIAPGITVREWDNVDGRQPVGQARMNLVTVDLANPAISYEYLAPDTLTKRKSVSHLSAKAGAMVGVNGDFFDISDTGAPLGIGIDRVRGMLNGSRDGWIPENMTLWFDGAGPHLSKLSARPRLAGRPAYKITGWNAPSVPMNGIGVYTKEWGKTSGTSVTDGDNKIREVVIVNGRVASNRYKHGKSGRKIKGFVLIGRGNARKPLSQLRKGMKVRPVPRLQYKGPQMAISGDRPLLVEGVRTVINDRLAHPRTAVGIDADGGKLLILTVDGRSSVSRGYTMVELADMMSALGAENALNLDGGGSTTMYSRNAAGLMGLINEPSDGSERLVPNGFGVVYHGDPGPVVPLPLTTPTPTPTVTPTVTPTPTPTVTPTVTPPPTAPRRP